MVKMANTAAGAEDMMVVAFGGEVDCIAALAVALGLGSR